MVQDWNYCRASTDHRIPVSTAQDHARHCVEWLRGVVAGAWFLTAIIPHPIKLDIARIFQSVPSWTPIRPGMRKVDNTLPTLPMYSLGVHWQCACLVQRSPVLGA